MAGIGFEIRKLLAKGTLADISQAYLYAGILSCGPWIVSIASIAILNLFLSAYLGEAERTFFSTTVTHAYALALILTGPLQLILTRHAADEISAGRTARLFPSCVAAMIVTSALSLISGFALFGCLTRGSLLYKAGAVALHVNISLIFVCTAYLGALRKFRSVVLAFVIGFSISGAGAWLAARSLGVPGAIVAFSMGQALLLCTLLVLLGKELGRSRTLACWDFLGTFRRFPALALCGFFYNFGIWIDKILFWWLSKNTLEVSGALRASPVYDAAVYLSLLSIAPGFAVFFLAVESDFGEKFQRFFEIIHQRGTLSQIHAAKHRMVVSLRSGFQKLALTQGAVTACLLAFAVPLGNALGIGALQLGIFQVTLLGSMLLILFLSMLTVLFYLDDRRGAMIAAAVFGIGNGLLSLATLLANEAWYGFGFVVATGAATHLAAIRVNRGMDGFVKAVFLPAMEH